MKNKNKLPVAELQIDGVENRILLIRGQKVMLDSDLAEMYGVETKSLNLAVKRNLTRFPQDFMFQLNQSEAKILRLQIETSKFEEKRGGRRYLPYAFTEQGIAMLSSVLTSDRAVQVNIAIMRAFVRLRQLLVTNEALARKILEMEQKYDEQFETVFFLFKRLENEPDEDDKSPIGFVAPSK